MFNIKSKLIHCYSGAFSLTCSEDRRPWLTSLTEGTSPIKSKLSIAMVEHFHLLAVRTEDHG